LAFLGKEEKKEPGDNRTVKPCPDGCSLLNKGFTEGKKRSLKASKHSLPNRTKRGTKGSEKGKQAKDAARLKRLSEFIPRGTEVLNPGQMTKRRAKNRTGKQRLVHEKAEGI